MSDKEVSRKRKCAIFEDKDQEEFEECSFTYVLTNFMEKKTKSTAEPFIISFRDCNDPRLPGGQWGLQVYPSGEKAVLKNDHVSVFVGLRCSEDTEVEADYIFEILDPKSSVLYSESGPAKTATLGKRDGVALLFYGSRKCFAHVDIEKDSLFDGHLTIRVNLRYRIVSGGFPADKLTPSGIFLRSLQKQENSAKSSDIVLITSDGLEFPAHKFVLSMQSDVFAAMFEHPSKEVATGKCVIDDLDGETVEAMIKYMYGKDEWKPELAAKVVIAANKYRIEILEEACVKELITQLNVENVLDFFALADTNNLTDLKSKSVDFIGGNLQAFVATGGLTRIYQAPSAQLIKDIEQLVQKQLAEVKK